jgi:hypothetical protein
MRALINSKKRKNSTVGLGYPKSWSSSVHCKMRTYYLYYSSKEKYLELILKLILLIQNPKARRPIDGS